MLNGSQVSRARHIEEVSKKLNIRKQYLIDLEEENFEAIPGKIYVDGYSKLYAEFLGINNETKESNIIKIAKKKEFKIKNRSDTKKRYQKYVVLISLALLILIFLLYNLLRNDVINDEILNKTEATKNENYETIYVGNYSSD